LTPASRSQQRVDRSDGSIAHWTDSNKPVASMGRWHQWAGQRSPHRRRRRTRAASVAGRNVHAAAAQISASADFGRTRPAPDLHLIYTWPEPPSRGTLGGEPSLCGPGLV
jgi:hypothetical protein